MKIIFLDIDGVLNCQAAYEAGQCKYTKDVLAPDFDRGYSTFCSWSKEYLNRLIDESGAKVVISSTWRHSGLEYMKLVWELEGMSGEIIDITPSFRGLRIDGEHSGYTLPRGCEIESWLRSKGYHDIFWSEEEQDKWIDKCGIENYIIIDDDSDMLYTHRNHFVHVYPAPRNYRGFDKEHYEKGLAILSERSSVTNYRQ